MIKKLRIGNDLGLHARSAAKIVSLVAKYEAELFLKKGEQEVEGQSILSILSLSCPKGTEIEIRTLGDDSEALMEAVTGLIKGKFGEEK